MGCEGDDRNFRARGREQLAKAKNVETAKAAPADAGDVWTWTALDAELQANRLVARGRAR